MSRPILQKHTRSQVTRANSKPNSACPQCYGTLGVDSCQHGDATDRAFRALLHVEEERAAAQERKAAGLPVNVQEGCGETYERAGKREGVCGSYVRRLERIVKADAALGENVRAKKISIKEAWMRVRVHGALDDTDTWLTPDYILTAVRSAAGGTIDLDPATLTSNPTNAREFYALERDEDGLSLPWHVDRRGRTIKNIFTNPPYCDGALGLWVPHAIRQAKTYSLAIWLLMPAATGTQYGQAAIREATDVLFFDGRVPHLQSDGKIKGSPQFDSMLVAFGNASCASMTDLGTVMVMRSGAA